MPVDQNYPGGYAFGQGEVAVSAGGTGTLPTTSPATPVLCDKLILFPHTIGSGEDIDDIIVETCTFDDIDIIYKLAGGDQSGPWRIYAPDSRINPSVMATAMQQTTVTVTLGNTAASNASTVAGAWRAAVASGAGYERAAGPSGAYPKGGMGRVINLGQSVDTGATRSGQVVSAQDLLLYHLNVQTESDVNADLLVGAIQVNDLDYLSGSTAPSQFFRHDNPVFSFGGKRIGRADSVTVTTESGTSGTHSEGITARLAS